MTDEIPHEAESTGEYKAGTYELVMPFVLTKDNGGPFDGPAFVAGWSLGELDMKMQVAKTMHLPMADHYLSRILKPQIDLLCMKHSFAVAVEEVPEEQDPDGYYYLYSFERVYAEI